MNVQLTPELEQLVEAKVQSGRNASASDVVIEALRLLGHLDESFALDRNDARCQIEEGWQAAQRGELVDGDDVLDRLEAELDELERASAR